MHLAAPSTLLLTVLAACGAAPGDGSRALPEVPWPTTLEGFDPSLVAALDAAAEAVRADLTDARAWRELGLTYEAHLKVGLARRAYEGAVVADPEDARAWYRLAVMRGREADVDGALAAYARVHALAPDYAPAFRKRGRFLVDVGRAAQAQEAFEAALALTPEDASARLGLVQVALALDEPERALAELDRLGSLPAAQAAFGALLRGQALQRLGRVDEATATLARGRGARATGDDPWLREVARYKVGESALVLRADRLLARNDLASALALLENLDRDAPDDARVQRRLGRTYARLGRWSDAGAAFARAAELVPDDLGSLLAAASAYDSGGDGAGALEAVEELVARAAAGAPELEDAHSLRAALLLEAGAPGRALAARDQAAGAGVMTASLEVTAGKAALALDRPTDARAHFERALELDGRSADAWAGAALLRAADGETAAALAALARVAELDDAHPLLPAIEAALANGGDGR